MVQQWQNDKKSYMIYRILPFAMTLNDPEFTDTLLFDVECLRKKGTR